MGLALERFGAKEANPQQGWVSPTLVVAWGWPLVGVGAIDRASFNRTSYCTEIPILSSFLIRAKGGTKKILNIKVVGN